MRILLLVLLVFAVASTTVDGCKGDREEVLSLTVMVAVFEDVLIDSGYSRLDLTIGEHDDVFLEFETWFESKAISRPEIRADLSFSSSGIEEFQYERGVVEIGWFRYGEHGWSWLREDITSEAVPYSHGMYSEKFDQSLGVCVYPFDIAGNVKEAQEEILSRSGLDCDASDILVKGKLSFSARIWGCVRKTVGTERDVMIRVRFLNVTDLDTTLRTPERTIILHAKAEEDDMLRVLPNKVKYTFQADSNSSDSSVSSIYKDMYVEWRTIELPQPLWEKAPWNWILSGIAGFMIGSTLDRIITIVTRRRRAEKERKAKERQRAILMKKKKEKLRRAPNTRSARRARKKK